MRVVTTGFENARLYDHQKTGRQRIDVATEWGHGLNPKMTSQRIGRITTTNLMSNFEKRVHEINIKS